MFLSSLRTVQRVTASLTIPRWARPGPGRPGARRLLRADHLFVGWRLAQPGQGLGLLGGGYGAVQLAISGADWLPIGWAGVGLLAGLCLAKIIASSLTIGSGGSAGDFAPALVIGGLFGGAFGRAAQIAAQRSAHRARAPSRWSRWGRSTAASRTCRCRRWCWCASWRAATTCWCRSCSPRGSRSSRCAAGRSTARSCRPSATHPPTSTRRSTSCARRASAR